MSAPPILAARRAIVRTMLADPVLTASAVGTRIYGERTQPSELVWPFVRCDGVVAIPNWRINALVHAFSKGPFTDEVHYLTEIIADLFDAAVLDLQSGDRRAFVNVANARVIRDGAEADAWHGIVTIQLEVPKDCLAA